MTHAVSTTASLAEERTPRVSAVVSGLGVTAVKATRLLSVEEIRLERDGVRENRRFFLIDGRDRMVNSKRIGALQTIVADYSDGERRLSLTFPDGAVVSDQVRLGEAVQTEFYSSTVSAPLVLGPWAEAISELAGQPLRLVASDRPWGAVDREQHAPVSLISRASLGRLAAEGGCSAVDVRRFRMLLEIDGVGAHAEDSWVGGPPVRIGSAVVEFKGHVGRCAITTRNPDSGEVDLPTLKLLGRYRRDLDTTEPVAFGVYGVVTVPGLVRVGDPVTVP
jgi:uncharacterized protein